MVDVRKELSLIDKHIQQRNREASESIIYFEFDPLGAASAGSGWSVYDEVYDQGIRGDGGRSFRPGKVINTIYVEELEDQANANEEGRQPIQNIRVVMHYLDVLYAGVGNPREYQDKLKDIFFYDGRYYRVYKYRARGRLEREVLVTIEGFEVYLDQEYMFDVPPAVSTSTLPWPDTFPEI